MATFAEVLAEFKDNEDVENIIPVMNNLELQSSIIAWKSIKIHFAKHDDCTYTDPNDKWNWLWTQIEYDPSQFAVVAGLRPQDSGRVLLRLIGLRLIYPDGTINHCAKIYMQGLFRASLNKVSPAKPGRPKKQG